MMRADRETEGTLSGTAEPLEDFVALTANVTEAYTAALLLVDDSGNELRIAACHSLSDHLIRDARPSARSGLWAELLRRGAPTQEPHFHGDSAELGIYSEAEEIRAYMTAPVGDLGLLWVDTRRTYSFTAKDLKILGEFARTAESLLGLHQASERLDTARWELDLLAGMIPKDENRSDLENYGLDFFVDALMEKGGFDGVLAATEVDGGRVLRIDASEGFADWVRRGRLVRKRAGAVKEALDGSAPVFIENAGRDDSPATLFHAKENVGFDVKSLVVVPASRGAQRGVLVAASARPDPRLKDAETALKILQGLVGLVRSVSFHERLLARVRRHDGESGLISEGYFRRIGRELLEEVKERKGRLVLLLSQVTDIDEIYVRHDHALVNRFLEEFTDRLAKPAHGHGVMGKFRTGGFGLLLEDVPRREVDRLVEKTLQRFSPSRIDLGEEEILFHVRVSAAHYPEDCSDLPGLWETALSRLEEPAPGQ
jgi:GGDEF domain-containing protein